MNVSSPRRFIDLSHPLSAATPPFPGDPPLEIRVFDATVKPAVPGEFHANCSHLAMSLHCGTHMDAPFHFIHEGRTIDQVPLERCTGEALVLRLPYQTHGMVIDAEHLAPHEAQLRATRRVILNTGWHHRWKADDYFTAHPVISVAAASLLVRYGEQLVGVDFPSVDRAPYETHLELLGNDLLIVENLTNLDAIPGDTIELVALPLAIAGRDGSPVRAVAIV
jgi:kynurenine formamidase